MKWKKASIELPDKLNCSYYSDWVVVSDGKQWTIAHYDYNYRYWQKDHSPYDLNMDAIIYWMKIDLDKILKE